MNPERNKWALSNDLIAKCNENINVIMEPSIGQFRHWLPGWNNGNEHANNNKNL